MIDIGEYLQKERLKAQIAREALSNTHRRIGEIIKEVVVSQQPIVKPFSRLQMATLMKSIKLKRKRMNEAVNNIKSVEKSTKNNKKIKMNSTNENSDIKKFADFNVSTPVSVMDRQANSRKY